MREQGNVATVLAGGLSLLLASAAAALVPPAEERARAAPLEFEENLGQAAPAYRYLARLPGGALMVGEDGATLVIEDPGRSAGDDGGAALRRPAGSMALVRMRVEGLRAARVVGAGELPGRSHYYVGADPAGWVHGARHYGAVRQEDPAAGIDVVYRRGPDSLAYDLVVAPGADPEGLRLSFEGARSLALDGNGDLVLETALGQVRQSRPRLYQEVAGGVRAVEGCFALDGDRVAFELGGYDASEPLVIDPDLWLWYSTYLGGSGDDNGARVVASASGEMYATGTAGSLDFPSLGCAPPLACSAVPRNAFVSKIAASGASLVYSVFLGGSGFDDGTSLAVDAGGNAFATGYTESFDFPVTTPPCTGCGIWDAYLVKLDPAGALLVSHRFGGSDTDLANDIALDDLGDPTIVGFTHSVDFPRVAAPDCPTCGNRDGFLTKLHVNGPASVATRYSMRLGGSSVDSINAVSIDVDRAAFFTGATRSLDFPVTASALQPALGGCPGATCTQALDAIAGQAIDDTGTARVLYATYLGGAGDDEGLGIAVDNQRRSFITGYTQSGGFPVVRGFQSQLRGTRDAFLTRLEVGGSAIGYSTFLGGTGPAGDGGRAVGVAEGGLAYVSGYTTSTDFPGGYSLRGSADAFLAEVRTYEDHDASLGAVALLGGTSTAAPDPNEAAAGVFVRTPYCPTDVYLTGYTRSSDFPTLLGPLCWPESCPQPVQGTNGGGADAFVTRYNTTTLELVACDPQGDWAFACDPCRTRYCAGAVLSRAQLAQVILESHGETPLLGTPQEFDDVPACNPLFGWVQRLRHVATGSLSDGCRLTAAGTRLYCPLEPANRSEAALMLARLHALLPPSPVCNGTFTDVPASPVETCAAVEALAATGVPGCGGNSFCPGNLFTRQEAAVWVARLDGQTPSGCSGLFDDVTVANPSCADIEWMAPRVSPIRDPKWSCFNQRLDYNETGVDCGSWCKKPCPDAAYSTQTVDGQFRPSCIAVHPGEAFTVAITMKATGADWVPGAHVLASQNPAGNTTWGSASRPLAAPVPAGGSTTFSWTATAPAVAGSYNFQWQMKTVGGDYFGQPTVNVGVTVMTPTGAVRSDPCDPHRLLDENGDPLYVEGMYNYFVMSAQTCADPPSTNDNFFRSLFSAFRDNKLNFFRDVFSWNQASPSIKSGCTDFAGGDTQMDVYRRVGPGLDFDGRLRVDLDQLNQDYLDYWDRLLDDARAKGVVVLLTVIDSWHSNGCQDGTHAHAGLKHDHYFGTPGGDCGTTAAVDNNINGLRARTPDIWHSNTTRSRIRELIDELVDRLGDHPNLIWEVANEAKIPNYDAWELGLGNYIKSVEASRPRQHLVMPNDLPNHDHAGGKKSRLGPSPSPYPSHRTCTTSCSANPGPSCTCPGERDPVKTNCEVTKAFNDFGQPTIADTDGGDSECNSPDEHRSKAWAALTAGGHLNMMSSDFEQDTDLTDMWVKKDMKFLGNTRRFLLAHGVTLRGMVPSNGDVAGNAFCLARRPAAGQPPDEYVIYVRSGAVTLTNPPPEFEYWWFDPCDPAAGAPGPGTPCTSTGCPSFLHSPATHGAASSCPGGADWVLYIRRK